MTVDFINAQTGERIAVSKLPALVGRDSRADVVIPDAQVSRYQCMMDKTPGGGLVVWDLGLGTCLRVNGRPARTAYLRPGDELTLGRSRFRVEYGPVDGGFTEAVGTASGLS